MTSVEATGKTVEEAVEKALQSLGVKRDNVDIEVLDAPNQGLFGLIGQKDARVLVKVRHAPEEYMRVFLQDLLNTMGLRGIISVHNEEGFFLVNISGRGTACLIGRRGRVLNELQYLLNTIMRRQFASLQKRVLLDIENYRQRREKTLQKLAQSIARKVILEGKDIALEPMPPQERRIIHLALKDYPGVITFSTGEDPYRKVVITNE